MKIKNLNLIGLVALFSAAAVSSAIAQDVSSTPVGYVTITINGNGYTALSNPLENAVVYSGTTTSVSGDTITTSFPLTAGELAGTDAEGMNLFYVQTSSGSILDISSNTDSTITLTSDVSSELANDDTIYVKEYSTISDLLGANNEAGLTSGGSSSSSDVVYIMSADGLGSYNSYYYQTDLFGFLGGTGWRAVGDTSTDMSNIVIGPDDGVLVNRISAEDLSVVVSGTVNTLDHTRTLPAGFSLVSYPFPVDTTLNDSGIYAADNGYVSGSSAASSDLVYVIATDGSFTTYYYQTDLFGFLGGTGWREVSSNTVDTGSAVIPAGSSIIIKHIGSGLAWNDAIPYTL